MTKFTTNQRAYAGQFSVMDSDSKRLIHGGGVTTHRPRLYLTAESAIEAAASMRPESYGATRLEAVELV